MDETPGTYWWHGHAGVERVDGFYGPLIVRPNGPEALVYDEERMLLISDSFHGQANAMTFGRTGARQRPSPGSVRVESCAWVHFFCNCHSTVLKHLSHCHPVWCQLLHVMKVVTLCFKPVRICDESLCQAMVPCRSRVTQCDE